METSKIRPLHISKRSFKIKGTVLKIESSPFFWGRKRNIITLSCEGMNLKIIDRDDVRMKHFYSIKMEDLNKGHEVLVEGFISSGKNFKNFILKSWECEELKEFSFNTHFRKRGKYREV